MPKPKQGKVKHVILTIGIAIILAFFIGYGISLIYKSPQYEKYCPQRTIYNFEIQEKCEANNGNWTAYNEPEARLKIPENQYTCTKVSEINKNITMNCILTQQASPAGYCDVDYFCRQNFEKDNTKYNRDVFIITLVVGIIIIIASTMIQQGIVSVGLLSGSFLVMIYGVIRYWSQAGDWLRLIVLGIVLGILIWMAYKRFSK